MTKFWKFECHDAASAEVCVRGLSLPPEVKRHRDDESYANALEKLRPGHGVVLGKLLDDSSGAQVFAVGRVIGPRGGGSDVLRVVWKAMRLRFEPQGVGQSYWKQTACEIKSEPAKRYGLAEHVASVGVLSPRERVEYAAKLEGRGYTGPSFERAPETCDLLAVLESAGFAVTPRGKKLGEPGDGLPRGTIRVVKSGVYLAYVPSGHIDAIPVEHLIGLAYLHPGTRRTAQAMPLKPTPFDEKAMTEFARERGVPSEHLKLVPEKGAGERYLRITNFDTALTLILQNERLLDGLPLPTSDEVDDLDFVPELDELGSEDNGGSKQGDSLESRCKRFAEVEVRPEQRAFRIAVFNRWNGKCVVSGCAVPEALEAAHMHGRNWKEGHNDAEDGFLMRRDLHTLYDRHLLQIEDGLVALAADVHGHYAEFHGVAIPAPHFEE